MHLLLIGTVQGISDLLGSVGDLVDHKPSCQRGDRKQFRLNKSNRNHSDQLDG